MLKGMEKGKMVPRGSANRYARNIFGMMRNAPTPWIVR